MIIYNVTVVIEEAVEQEYKTAKRSHLSTVPTNTIVDLAINFSLNLNGDNQMYVYNTLKAWKNFDKKFFLFD